MNKLKRGLPVLATRFDPDEADYLKVIKDDEYQLVLASNDEYRWFAMEFDKELNGVQQVAVESYYCGFLAYYDQQARSGLVDHDIFFDWNQKGKTGQLKLSSLNVYIFPAPLKKGEMKEIVLPSIKPDPKMELLAPRPFTKFLEEMKKKQISSIKLAPSTAAQTSSSVSDPPTPKGPPPPPTS